MSGRLRIAIDGPSGAGKSTLARALAERLDLPYVDTGAMYRGVAYQAMIAGAATETEILALLGRIDLQVVADPRAFRVRVDGHDITDCLRAPEVGKRASEVAQIPAVRRWLVQRQRRLARDGAVLEGRDIATVVMPDADLKLFVTASEQVRMERRAAQLGESVSERVHEDIRARDRRDLERASSPLRRAEGAVVVDTSRESPERSLERILGEVRRLQEG